MDIQEAIAKANPREVRELAKYLYDYILHDHCCTSTSNEIVLKWSVIESALEAYGGGAAK